MNRVGSQRHKKLLLLLLLLLHSGHAVEQLVEALR